MEQRLDSRDGPELPEGAPGVNRRPYLEALRIGLVELFVGSHLDQLRNVLRSQSKIQVVRPLAKVATISEGQQLGNWGSISRTNDNFFGLLPHLGRG